MYPLVSLSIPVYTVVEYKKDTKGYLTMKQSTLSNVMSINSKRLAMNILGRPDMLKVTNNPGIMVRDLAIGTLAPALLNHYLCQR